jgi:predicted acetyltransferase
MHIELVSATLADRERLENLFELYLHDFSELLGYAPGEDGRFGYPPLDLYWKERGRFPFLIRADGRLAGFVLVASGSQVSGDPDVFDMAEFFVVRGLRRHGVGLAAAAQAFAAFPGTWEVRVMGQNTAAQRFWERAVPRFAPGRFAAFAWRSARGSDWQVFRFVSPGVTAPSR